MASTRNVPAISSAEEFIRLRTSDDPENYLRAAHGTASLETWLEVIALDSDMRYWVAHNKTVPDEVLYLLANDADARVRSMVASRRACPHSVIHKLAVDPDESVRARIVFNAKAPRSTLEILQNDPSGDVARKARERLARLSAK